MTTTPPTPAKGGMPKWLIILLVVFLIIMIGCCGLFTGCWMLARHAANKADEFGKEFQAQIEKAQKQAEAEAAKAAAEARARGETPTPPAAPANDAGAAGAPAAPEAPAPAAPAAPEAPAADAPANATHLPKNFPADIPTYEGFVPTFVVSDNTNGSGTVTFSSTDSSDKIVAFYEKEMATKGWKQERSMNMNDNTIMLYTKDDMKATISIAPDGTKSMTSVIYEKKQ